MPVQSLSLSGDPSDPRPDPRLHLRLTPHKSLTPEGFVWFIGATSVMIAIPLLSILGNPVFWFLLPFILAAVCGVWLALKRSWRDHDIYEEVTIWDDHMRLERHHPREPMRDWEANPYWVRLILHPKGGPVPNYLTLQGGDREVELGAFLTPQERLALKATLEPALRAKG